MSLLLSNDDGVHAPGLAALTKALSERFEVMVVAPDRDHSGASSALTLSRPLKVTRVDQHVYAVDGTPADSAHLGITSICQDQGFSAERVISGINSHENLGDDVLYSGTVAAAIEGRFLSLSPLAVSLVNRGNNHFGTAARVVLDLLDRLGNQTFPANTILNINVPDVPYNALKGTRVTRLGHRAKGLPPEKTIDPRGRERYWIALAGDGEDAGEGTDFWAVEHGYVSLTPIQVDMTAHQAVDTLKTILQ